MDKHRIVIVDDHPMVRLGVVRTLEKQSDFLIVGEGETGADAVRLAQEHLPDVILLDISMPDGGIEAAQQIATSCPAVKIVFLTVSEDEGTILRALEVGARGYILKGVSGPDFVKTLRNVAEGDAVVLPSLASRILSVGKTKPQTGRDLLSQLTAREMEILQQLAQGKTNRDIGDTLGLTERTVKHYMHNILQKLHVRSRVAAALLAERELAKPTDR